MLAWNWSFIRNILLSSLITLVLGVISSEGSKAIADTVGESNQGIIQS